ncbi:unnamed protein product [Vitrella brassicaformis CCMP3155]|uniref:Phospholipid-transporting ATPase n=1 Tax=Vitrella brassicaformis (strain CCMP3155) TaxID=1169540 RepID=A0A0G4EMR9_VITBC|nr:unnamed protein product [Vitrella brassicaformis CCMP3155]|eukprot:CEL98109.1 unnamed protein product [Vitrella brassicaformis CCMP3155]
MFPEWAKQWGCLQSVQALLKAANYPFGLGRQGSIHEHGEKFRAMVLKEQYIKKGPYCSNFIKTSKYEWWNFVPKSLFHLFRQIANFYFLIIAILQTIPDISPLQPFSAWVPLLFVLSVSMIREGSEDIRRHRSDRRTNSQKTRVLRDQTWVETRWLDVQVGDIIQVLGRESVPADLILLQSSTSDGKCFIQTASLDGETNLKPRSVLPQAVDMNNNQLVGLRFETEEPRGSLEDFDARLYLPTASSPEERYPVTIENFLPRESYLRHVDWILGAVVFTGHDTRVMKGQAPPPQKLSAMDRMVNRLVLSMMMFQACVCATLAFLNFAWHERNRDGWYLDDGLFEFKLEDYATLTFWSYVLLMNTMIPISLLVSIEMVKFVQALFIGWDIQMMYIETDRSGGATKRWASWSTSTLNEELGQVRYVFSDKTGTLTTNMMEFRACTVGKRRYGMGGEESTFTPMPRTYSDDQRRASRLMDIALGFDDSWLINDLTTERALDERMDLGNGMVLTHHSQVVEHFLLCMALCQDVTPEGDQGFLIYSGLSPDEVCLVDAARQMGYTFWRRTDEHLTLQIRHGSKTKEFDLLRLIKFSNSRKRSSVIVRDPDTQIITLYSKGADDVMLPQCPAHLSHFVPRIEAAVDTYSKLGLRTLCLGCKTIEPSYWEEWRRKAQVAGTILEPKEKDRQLNDLYSEIELGCMLLSATGTEDKIQNGVPECIERLRMANISVWMITGDKLDTAVEIAKSCRLLDMQEMRVDIVDAPNKHQTKAILMPLRPADDGKYAIVISGRSLEQVFRDPEMTEHFFHHTVSCAAAVVCRATKSQKAEVVHLIKSRMPEVITLSIGDGANDVPMLKEAHVGIGVFGKEGNQAVQNSDYAIAQFRFLERLLFVHGRWSYVRLAKLISYFFYKNITYTVPQFLFGFYSAYSAKSFYDDWYIATYNFLFTSLPVLAMGMFEQDVNPDMGEEIRREYPKFYSVGQRNLLFNRHCILLSWTQGFAHSFVCFFIAMYGLGDIVHYRGHTEDFWYHSLLTYMSCVCVVTVNVLIRMRHWSWIFILTIVASILVYFFWMMVYDLIDFNTAYRHATALVQLPSFWLSFLLILAVTSMSHFGFTSYMRWFHPTVVDVYQELQHKERREQAKKEGDEEPPTMLGNMAPFNRGLSEVTVDNPNDTTHTSSHTHPSHPSHRMRPPPPFNGDRCRTDMDGMGGPEDDLNEGNVRVKPLSELPVGGEGIGAISPGPVWPRIGVGAESSRGRERDDGGLGLT